MKRTVLAVAALCLATVPVVAQTTTPGVTAGSEVLGVKYQGAWSSGTHLTQSYDLMDFGAAKTTHLFAQVHEVLAPTPGFSVYAGGATLQPDLSKLLSRTNLPASNFQFSATGALGNGVTSGPSHLSWLTGASLSYRLGSNVQWQSLSFTYGKVGSQSFTGVSTGLSYFFGGAAQAATGTTPTTTTSVKKMSRPAMP